MRAELQLLTDQIKMKDRALLSQLENASCCAAQPKAETQQPLLGRRQSSEREPEPEPGPKKPELHLQPEPEPEA